MSEDDMTDRELLKLAAKAAGISVSAVPPWSGYNDKEGFYEMNMDGSRVTSSWNPLNDDGDALRLAVKLHLDLDFEKYGCCANNNCIENTTMGYGLEEATRRAIVRAAAEIGKTK